MKLARFHACLGFLAAFNLISFAASKSTILGTVHDAPGAVVANATMTVKNESTNFSREITTNEGGDYVTTNLDRFEDFPVDTLHDGTPAAPKFVRREERQYRAVIRNGVMKGDGVLEAGEGTERRGLNFAGRYIVVQWGCDSECLQYAIVDAVTGRIFQPPVPR